MSSPIWFPSGEDVTVVRAGTSTDEYGNTVTDDWNNPTETVYNDCAVGHGPASQQWLVGRDITDVALTVYMPYDADVTTADRMIVRGVTYDVYDVFAWASPFTGTQAGKEVALKTREG